ncbi:MAG: hypothetical protein K2K09_04830, partial [Lachnospiraceae bacterium]|nr:hypothetical protein [Lachnospiraceae bacterium]
HISEEKERMLEISIFSDKNSFAYKNIIKIKKDYGNISGVELSDIDDYAVDCFLGYDAMYIIGFIIMMFTVITFLDERKIVLWQIVHICSGGRLQDFILPVSLLWFIVYYVVFLSAALAVEGLFVWCVLSFIHNRNLEMIVCVCTFVPAKSLECAERPCVILMALDMRCTRFLFRKGELLFLPFFYISLYPM